MKFEFGVAPTVEEVLDSFAWVKIDCEVVCMVASDHKPTAAHGRLNFDGIKGVAENPSAIPYPLPLPAAFLRVASFNIPAQQHEGKDGTQGVLAPGNVLLSW